jgi:hypothetical protein
VFWRWDRLHEGKEVWFGTITFDERVGFSQTTGQVTHHIGADLQSETGSSQDCSRRV